MTRIKVFTDRYPWLGPAIWILTVEYFIVQLIVAAAWPNIPYSWRFNTISDLGNTACGYITGIRYVCSPFHVLMNASFMTLGILMATGSLLIYQEFRQRRKTIIGFSLMVVAGYGSFLVGLFPENTSPVLHIFGASLPFFLGNMGLVVLGLGIFDFPKIWRIYSVISGVVPLFALPFFATHHYFGLGVGGMERLVAYPQTIWLIFFGFYMMHNHYSRRRKRELHS